MGPQILNCQTQSHFSWLLYPWYKKSLVRQFGAEGISTLSGNLLIHCHNNFKLQKCIERSYFHIGGGLLLVLGSWSSACWYGIHSRSSNPLHNWHCHFVGGTSQLTHSAIRSTCKSFRTPLCLLLIAPYNFVYYNVIIMQWLVGSRQKGGLCLQ